MPRVSNFSIELNKLYPNPERAQDITERVHRFRYTESLISGETPWVLELIATNLGSEENLLLDDRNLAFRISLTCGTANQTTGWRLVRVAQSYLFYRGSVPVIHLEGSSLVYDMKTQARWRSFVNVPIQTVFKTIANEYGMRVRIPEIEFNGTWYQCGENDWEFLRAIVKEIPIAFGQRRGWLFLDNRVLELRVLNYSKATVRRLALGEGDDRSNQIKLQYFGREAEQAGSSEVNYHGFDIRNATSIEYTPPDSIAPVLSGKLPRKFGAAYHQVSVPLQTKEQVAAFAVSDWSENTAQQFGAHINLVGDVGIRPGDLVDITVTDPDGRSSSLGGKYPVWEVMHNYDALPNSKEKGFSTHLACFRRTSLFGQDVATGTNFSRSATIDRYSVQEQIDPDPVILEATEL